MAGRLVVKLALSVALAGALVLGLRAQQAPPATPPAQTPAATPAPAPPRSPDQIALTAAMALRDPAEKIAALEKIRTDFPTSAALASVDSQLLTTLSTVPGKTSEITVVLDRMLGRISPTASPEIRLNSVMAAVTPLVTNKVLLDRADKLMTDALAALDFEDYAKRQREAAKARNAAEPVTATMRTTFDASFRGRALDTMARLYLAKGDAMKAEAAFCDALVAMPNNPAVALGLAKLEVARGEESKGLDHYLTAAINAPGLRTLADQNAMRDLFAKVRGSADGLDAALDKIYNDTFPNPVTHEPYTPTANRSHRVVLLEMFTGSGCPPCVAADLALDAVIERYPSDAIVTVAYHQNIPAPDPMVPAGGIGRKDYYKVPGVPTFQIDGALGKVGGGARTGASNTYAGYIKSIDAALERPAQTNLALRAVGEGDSIKVSVDVSKLPADAKDLRLHILLVERELKFMGENGIRFHPMVVRATAGLGGAGIPITADGKIDHTFSLSAVKSDLTDTLAAEMVKRHAGEPAGSAPREYNAEGRAMTSIDTSELTVVAFVQSGAYNPPAPLPDGKPNYAPAFEPGRTNVLQAAAVKVTIK